MGSETVNGNAWVTADDYEAEHAYVANAYVANACVANAYVAEPRMMEHQLGTPQSTTRALCQQDTAQGTCIYQSIATSYLERWIASSNEYCSQTTSRRSRY